MKVNHQRFVGFAVAMSSFCRCSSNVFRRISIVFHLLKSRFREHFKLQFIGINLFDGCLSRFVSLYDGVEHGRLVVKRRLGKEMLFEELQRFDVQFSIDNRFAHIAFLSFESNSLESHLLQAVIVFGGNGVEFQFSVRFHFALVA